MSAAKDKRPARQLPLEHLMAVYHASDIETLFIKAYEETIGGPKEHAIFDFRLYRDGKENGIPAYIKRACQKHGITPLSD